MPKNKSIKKLVLFVFLFVSIAIIDSFRLTVVANDFYSSQLKGLIMPEINIFFGILAWIFITIGIYYFAVPKSDNYGNALINGGLFGLTTYAIYDFTNLAIINNWPVLMSVVDILWGGVLCATASVLGFFLANKVLKI